MLVKHLSLPTGQSSPTVSKAMAKRQTPKMAKSKPGLAVGAQYLGTGLGVMDAG
jgi:hypothetical protein